MTRIKPFCKNGHDQSLPGVRVPKTATKGSYCALCQKEHCARYREQHNRLRRCARCNREFVGFVSKCQKCARGGSVVKIQQDHTLELLTLGKLLENAMPWEREPIMARIESLRRSG